MWLGRVDQVSAAAGATIGHMTGPSMMQALLRFESGVTAIFEAMLAPAATDMEQPFFSIQVEHASRA
jgi:hypothetical protein